MMLPGSFSESGEWPLCLLIHLIQLFYEQVPHLPEQVSEIQPLITKPNLVSFCVCVCPCPSICLSIPPSVLPVSVVMVLDFDVEVLN